jgi:hypothetical protein
MAAQYRFCEPCDHHYFGLDAVCERCGGDLVLSPLRHIRIPTVGRYRHRTLALDLAGRQPDPITFCGGPLSSVDLSPKDLRQMRRLKADLSAWRVCPVCVNCCEGRPASHMGTNR